MDNITQQLLETDKKYLWHPFTQMAGWNRTDQVIIDSARGFYLFDTEGKRYIDGVSSLWCNVHGHGIKKIDDAIKQQLDKVAHSTLLGLGQTKSIELAQKLVDITPPGLEKVFYSDSGSTSVEIALKMAYQYFQNIGLKDRTRFIAFSNSYHGDTIGSVSVGGIGLFHGIFRKLLFETFFVENPHPYRFNGTEEECANASLAKIEELLKTNKEKIAGIVMEPLIQGAAGMIVHPIGFLKRVRQLADKYEVLLITDEVATAFGRTGKMFACEHEQVEPDFMCLAKGITAGYLPLAATMTTQKVYDAFLGDISEHKTFYHGHTYTGNALGCAAAIASLELFEENNILDSLPEKIKLIERYLNRISQLPYIGDARQYGLMGGIEIVRDKATKESFDPEITIGAKICSALRSKGAMMRPLSDVIVLMPPVAIDIELLKELMEIVTNAVENELPKIVNDSL